MIGLLVTLKVLHRAHEPERVVFKFTEVVITDATEQSADAPCLIRGSIPAHGFVPLHSHAYPETFLAISGAIKGLIDGEWVDAADGRTSERISPAHDVVAVGEVHARPHDVPELEAGLAEGRLNDREDSPGLRAGVARVL